MHHGSQLHNEILNSMFRSFLEFLIKQKLQRYGSTISQNVYITIRNLPRIPRCFVINADKLDGTREGSTKCTAVHSDDNRQQKTQRHTATGQKATT